MLIFSYKECRMINVLKNVWFYLKNNVDSHMILIYVST